MKTWTFNTRESVVTLDHFSVSRCTFSNGLRAVKMLKSPKQKLHDTSEEQSECLSQNM